jgi:DNA/RNA-binding domain of Phe-tRNA-synthetase-like protein
MPSPPRYVGQTGAVLIVAEALHDSARKDVQALVRSITGEVDAIWSVTPRSDLLTASSPRFAF